MTLWSVACQSSLLRLWNSPGKNTGVGCHALLQGILNPGLLHCKQILYPLSHQGSPIFSPISHTNHSVCPSRHHRHEEQFLPLGFFTSGGFTSHLLSANPCSFSKAQLRSHLSSPGPRGSHLLHLSALPGKGIYSSSAVAPAGCTVIYLFTQLSPGWDRSSSRSDPGFFHI